MPSASGFGSWFASRILHMPPSHSQSWYSSEFLHSTCKRRTSKFSQFVRETFRYKSFVRWYIKAIVSILQLCDNFFKLITNRVHIPLNFLQSNQIISVISIIQQTKLRIPSFFITSIWASTNISLPLYMSQEKLNQQNQTSHLTNTKIKSDWIS